MLRLMAAIRMAMLGFAFLAATVASAEDAYPITIKHALGTTIITKKPERVATVAWANHEVPLALSVVPVGMSKATWGDDDNDGVLPWVEEKLEELGAKTPVLFDETDGIDFEAVADTKPDVILAAYSGLTQEEYETLSKIAPTVAYLMGVPEPQHSQGRVLLELFKNGGGVRPVTVIGLNDFHGQLDPTTFTVDGIATPVGGASRLATLFDEEAAALPGPALLLAGGDNVGASPPNSALIEDRPAIDPASLTSRKLLAPRSNVAEILLARAGADP